MSAKARLNREINGLRERILSMRIARAIELEIAGVDASADGSVYHKSNAMIDELSEMLQVKQKGLRDLIAK